MKIKSQSAIEFLVLVGAIIFFFIILSYSFQQNIAIKAIERRNLELQDLALSIQNEVDLAHASVNGYKRTFTIPSSILNLDYTLTLTEGIIYIQTVDNKHAIALPTQNITGTIVQGSNTIRKNNGTVTINS